MNSSKVKIMQILLGAFCFSQISFALITISLNLERMFLSFGPSAEDAGLFPLFPLLGLGFIALGMFLFQQQLSAIPNEASANEKIGRYQTAFIIRCAFLEAASLMNIVGFFLSGNVVFLFVAAISLMLMIVTRPTRNGLIDALSLSYPDTEKL
jgi:uncharacterized membrane protein